MPIRTQSDLPAKEKLENENIFVMDETRAMHQDIRPLKVCILNLMPLKEETELQLLRVLSNTPLQIDVSFMTLKSHVSLNTSASHLNKFYITYDDVMKNKTEFDFEVLENHEFTKVNIYERKESKYSFNNRWCRWSDKCFYSW